MLRAKITFSRTASELSVNADVSHDRHFIAVEPNPFLSNIVVRSDDSILLLAFERTKSAVEMMADRPIGAGCFASAAEQTRCALALADALDSAGCAYSLIRFSHPDDAGGIVTLRMSAYYPVPLYVRRSSEYVEIDWDIVRMMRAEKTELNLDYAAQVANGHAVYGSETIAKEITMLLERSEACVDATSFRICRHADAGLPQRRTLKSDFEASALVADRLAAFMADRCFDGARLGIEVSGGIDSALLLLLLARSRKRALSAGVILTELEREAPQVERIRALEDRTQVGIWRVHAWAHLGQTCFVDADEYAADAFGEYCWGAFGSLWDHFASEGCNAVVGGYGGDELFLHDEAESIAGVDAQGAAPAERPYSAAIPIVSPSALFACAQHAPSLLRRGLWPIRPYCDPLLARMCYALPLEAVFRKRPLTNALESMMHTDMFRENYIKESFNSVIHAAIDSEWTTRNSGVVEHDLLPQRIWLEEIAGKLMGVPKEELAKHLARSVVRADTHAAGVT